MIDENKIVKAIQDCIRYNAEIMLVESDITRSERLLIKYIYKNVNLAIEELMGRVKEKGWDAILDEMGIL